MRLAKQRVAVCGWAATSAAGPQVDTSGEHLAKQRGAMCGWAATSAAGPQVDARCERNSRSTFPCKPRRVCQPPVPRPVPWLLPPLPPLPLPPPPKYSCLLQFRMATNRTDKDHCRDNHIASDSGPNSNQRSESGSAAQHSRVWPRQTLIDERKAAGPLNMLDIHPDRL